MRRVLTGERGLEGRQVEREREREMSRERGKSGQKGGEE